MTWTIGCSPTQFWLGWIMIAAMGLSALIYLYRSVRNQKRYEARIDKLDKDFERVTKVAKEEYEKRIKETNKVRTEYLAMIMEMKGDELPDPGGRSYYNPHTRR